MCIQGVQQHQIPVHMENGLHGTTGTDNQSSYVSSSGIKSVLLNAWSTVKSAVSGMLSSFGLHLSGEQGSDKPGREIVMYMSCRPLPPLPGMDAQFEGNIYESGDGNICNSVGVAKSECPGREIVIDMTRRPLPLLPLPGMDEQFGKTICGSHNNEDTYSEIEDYYSEVEGDYSEMEGNNSESEDAYSEVDENESSEVDVLENNTYEDPNVYRDTDNVIDSGDMVLVCDDTYADPHDSLTAGGRVESEETGYASLYENNYAVPYKPGNMVSIPDNDRKQSLPDAQLQQRIMRERLNIS
ncbi:hypothetical protein [Morganella morganii]|uniref:hypothetical protein n=1 Tax=Morganella morganii TaxID=582 RepID=UPI0034E59819